jgi:hypothetical protein
MLNWLPESNTFPSISQVTFKALLDAMKTIIEFIFTPLIEFVYVPFTDLLHTNLLEVEEMTKLRMYIILHRLPTSLRELGGTYAPIDLGYYLGKWKGPDSIGGLVLLGCEIGVGVLVLGDVMAYYSRSAVHSIPAEYSTPTTAVSTEHATTNHDSGVPVLDQRSSQKTSSSFNSGTSSKFSSASTTRTNTTTTNTTTITTPDDNITDHQSQTNSANQNQVRLPPQLVLRQYIYPKFTSTWPAYYLQAFNKAQESLTKEGNIHVDAPTSSGTRNNKDGCVGKIVLDRRVVKRDVKDGVVGYCEGVSGTVRLMMLVEVVADE